MEICYYQDPHLNFGDDLNEVIWPEVLPERLQQAPDVVVVGIGSILNEYILGKYKGTSKRLIVLGSGTSYGVPPSNLAEMQVLAVRGPYTASVIGQPQAAVTDGAILLAATKTWAKPAALRDKVLFMPHHRTLATTPWAEIAAACGMTYVSPQQPVRQTLAQFAQARLVVTEAMHGAIVADTLRVPWIPVAISPAVEEFKWRDWTLSMQLPFQPQELPAGTSLDQAKFAQMARVLKRAGIESFHNIPEGADAPMLRAYLERRFSNALGDVSATRPRRRAQLAAKVLAVGDGLQKHMAIRALRKASQGEQFLSKDDVFRSRLQQMLEVVDRAAALA